MVSIGRLVSITQAGTRVADDPTCEWSWLLIRHSPRPLSCRMEFSLCFSGNSVTSTQWLSSEIAVCIVSVSLPSIFFFILRGYREGPSSLIPGHTRRFRTKQNDSSGRYPGDRLQDDTQSSELILNSSDLHPLHKPGLSGLNRMYKVKIVPYHNPWQNGRVGEFDVGNARQTV